jgi:hypothetical protein
MSVPSVVRIVTAGPRCLVYGDDNLLMDGYSIGVQTLLEKMGIRVEKVSCYESELTAAGDLSKWSVMRKGLLTQQLGEVGAGLKAKTDLYLKLQSELLELQKAG